MTAKPQDPQIAAQGGVSEAPTASSSELQKMPNGHLHLKQQQAPAAKQMPAWTALPKKFTEPFVLPAAMPLKHKLPTVVEKKCPELFGDKSKRL
jgi:hypothetical protein